MIDLFDVLPTEIWEHFSFEKYYSHEQTILKPAIETLGYTNVRFSMGERDSFGPLSRIVTAESVKDGNIVRFYYM